MTIAIGSRVAITIATGVRANPRLTQPNGSPEPQLEQKAVGDQGTVRGGPVTADALVWWDVNFDTGLDGWIREVRMAEVVVAPPPPPPPPTSGQPTITRVGFNLARLLCLHAQYAGGAAYDRQANYHLCLTVDAFSLTFGVKSVAGGGGLVSFAHPQYRLTVNGTTVATYARVGTETRGTFTGNLGAEPDGPALLEIVPCDSTGAPIAVPLDTPIPFWCWIDRTGQAKNHPDVIVQTQSHSWTHESYSAQAWVRIPKVMLTRIARPLPARVGVPFANAAHYSQIVREQLVLPAAEANSMATYIPCLTNRGITVTENIQGYFPRDMMDPFPRLPQLDGERGIATCYYPLSIRAGRNGKWYHTTPHAFRVIDATGKVRTLAGLRHKYAPYHGHASLGGPESELVGDWSAVPAARRGMWESWGFVWDPRTTISDDTAPLIGGEPPHYPPGPVSFVVDRHGRILKLQFNHADRAVPPIVTEWATGLNDPWAIEFDPANHNLYVTERGAHRISKWSADTQQTYLGDVIADPNGAQYGSTPNPPPASANGQPRRFKWAAGHSITTARASPCVAPEGLALQDGFLYWGALADGQIRRINLATGVQEVCCRPTLSFSGVGSYFIQFALSDGTFGPRGTIFAVTFYNPANGRPESYLPVAGAGLTHSQMWNWHQYGYDVVRGAGGVYANDVYPTSCAVGNGMCATGSSLNAMNVHRLREATDPPATNMTNAKTGAGKWKAKNYDLLHGKFGDPDNALPLPWGEDANMDYWLQVHGHTKP